MNMKKLLLLQCGREHVCPITKRDSHLIMLLLEHSSAVCTHRANPLSWSRWANTECLVAPWYGIVYVDARPDAAATVVW